MVVGSMSALVTPFKNGKIDVETYESLIKRQIKYGMNACVPAGTTGESATMSHAEHKACIEIAVSVCKAYNKSLESKNAKNIESKITSHVKTTRHTEHSEVSTKKSKKDSKNLQKLDSKNALDSTNKKIKVLAGAGSNNTIEAIELAKFAKNCGADAILSVTPYYNKPTPSGLIAHYKAIAKAVDIPIMLYNVPGRTGCDISPELAMQLFAEIPNIYAIKEASGIIERVITLASLESNKVIESKTKSKKDSKDSNLKVLSGDDLLNYSILTYGGSGVISVTGNLLPDKISAMTESALNGDYKAAQKISNELYEINKILFIESNPIPIKAAMWLSGLLPTLEYRLPLCPPSGENMKKIEQTLRKYEVLK